MIDGYIESDSRRLEDVVLRCINATEEKDVDNNNIYSLIDLFYFGIGDSEEGFCLSGIIAFKEPRMLWAVKHIVGMHSLAFAVGSDPPTVDDFDLFRDTITETIGVKWFEKDLWKFFFEDVEKIMKGELMIPLDDIVYNGYTHLRANNEEYFDGYIEKKKELRKATLLFEIVRGCPTQWSLLKLNKEQDRQDRTST
jgi:hypothetical protein